MNEPNWPAGLHVYKPGNAAPAFIIANLAISADEFCNWLQRNKRQDGSVRVTIKHSEAKQDGRGDNYYAVLDTFVPQSQQGGM